MQLTDILTRHLYTFIEDLRLAGYNISTSQFILAQELVIRLAKQGQLALASLKTFLRPILCHSPREQQEFNKRFDNWVQRIEQPSVRRWRNVPWKSILTGMLGVGLVVNFPIIAGIVFSTGLLIGLVWKGWGRYRLQCLLMPRKFSAASKKVTIKQLDKTFFPYLSQLVQTLHPSVHQFDLQGSIEQSVHLGGWLSPRFKESGEASEYLVLIERVALQDQQAQLTKILINQLVNEGIRSICYDFANDPRYCYPAVSLTDLLYRYPHHKLLLCTDGEKFIQSEISLHFPYPCHLLTFAPERWEGREQLLRELGFILLPTSLKKLTALPKKLEEKPHRWLASRPPKSVELKELLSQLQLFLGSDAYSWLGACAVYPQLDWELTLYLGQQLIGEYGQALLTAENLTKLVRLPWFRHGRMPYWLRKQLVAEHRQDGRLRAALAEFLKSTNFQERL